MLEQAIHFKEESDALYNLLINADNNSFKLNTQFKSWTINDVLYHLHVWNIAALLSLKNENEFKEFMQNFIEAIKSGNSAREYEKKAVRCRLKSVPMYRQKVLRCKEKR